MELVDMEMISKEDGFRYGWVTTLFELNDNKLAEKELTPEIATLVNNPPDNVTISRSHYLEGQIAALIAHIKKKESNKET